MRKLISVGCLLAFLVGTRAQGQAAPDGQKVTVLKTPHGGIQPQAVSDAQGTLHLVYLKGPDGEADIFYVRRAPGQTSFSEPIRVNSQANSAVATGTIRGAQLALGKDGRLHVVWFGSKRATPRAFNDTAPLCYSRLDDSGKAFEPQRNLMTDTFNLDGGGTVAADDKGNVWVVWHALKVGLANGEGNRQVWVACSADKGKTFAPEKPAWSQPTGVCACCSLKAFADSKGLLFGLYRSATAAVNRDLYLLTSRDQGKTFQGSLVQKWKVNGCTMSSQTFTESKQGVFAAWETEKQVYFGKLTSSGAPGRPTAAPGPASERKHPALAANSKGEVLLAWTEGTGWQRGGALAWCVFDAAGKPTKETGRVERGIPVWGLPTAVATPNGEFIVIH